MKIERITTFESFLAVIPLEQEVREKGREKVKLSKYLELIHNNIENPYFGIWIAYDEEGIVLGYTIAVAMLFPGFERLSLLRMYAIDQETREALLEILYAWAKGFRLKKIEITVYKNAKAIERKYGYKPVSVNMERRI